MSSIYVCFSLKSVSTSMETNDVLEKNFQTVYKPIAKFLYSHPEFCFSLSLTGSQIQFFKKRRGELISICRELVDRKQIEVLGGGFYDPVLPLLYPVDRNGQIDMLSAEIRQSIGKRPRGISLFADCWDSSLVNNLKTCGIEYVLLDSELIPVQKRKFLPIIMSDLDKSVEIFPYYDSLIPDSKVSPKNYIQELIKTVDKATKKDTYIQLQPDRVVNINLNHEKLAELVESNWFEEFYNYLNENKDLNIKTSTPYLYMKNQQVTVPAFIPSGINHSIAKWIGHAYTEVDTSKQKVSYSVHDFMETYPQCKSLYNRILYISMLVNQYKNDKMRKKTAREKLWQAQNGTGLLCTPKGAFTNAKYRQQCYRYLMEAEKILREGEGTGFSEAVSCFDYNRDGINEYVCRMKNYFAFISLVGGSVQELDVLKSTGNYADNLSRVLEYDNCTDDYHRGLFVDHLLTEDQFKNYLKGQPSGDGIFSRIKYNEIKYSQSHHEIDLFASAVFPETKQKISLRKKYLINSNGMNVQYFVKNESNTKFKAKFAVESNFAHINFTPEELAYYELDVIDNGKKLSIDTTKTTEKLTRTKQLKNVYLLRLSDVENGVAFDFEPNESSSYCFIPLTFRRPDFSTNKIAPVGLTYVSTLYWSLEIEPGMEIEKNISFTISSIKKQKK